MEEYRKKLKRRVIGLSCFCVVSIMVIGICAVIAYGTDLDNHLSYKVLGFQCGFFTAGLTMVSVGLFRYVRALKKEALCRKLYIEEYDERTRVIKIKAGWLAYVCILCVSIVAVVVSGFFNETVFNTLVAAVFTTAIIGAVCKLIYHKIL